MISIPPEWKRVKPNQPGAAMDESEPGMSFRLSRLLFEGHITHQDLGRNAPDAKRGEA